MTGKIVDMSERILKIHGVFSSTRFRNGPVDKNPSVSMDKGTCLFDESLCP